jgi:hypothetical protein
LNLVDSGGPVRSDQTLVCRLLGVVMYLGKNQKLPLAILHSLGPNADTFFRPVGVGLTQVSLFLQMESFKVIALDKIDVNRNFPQLLQNDKTHESRDLCIKPYCIKRSFRLIFVMLKDMRQGLGVLAL